MSKTDSHLRCSGKIKVIFPKVGGADKKMKTCAQVGPSNFLLELTDKWTNKRKSY